MKKFFTNIPLQMKGALTAYQYEPVGNEKLAMDGKTCFPILTAVNGYAEPGEEFRMIAVCPDSEDGRRNLKTLEEEINALCRKKGCRCGGVDVVFSQKSQRVSDHTEVFQKLIAFAKDEDELFACITFGTKPQSQILQMAVQYSYRVKKDTSISCIVYGLVDRTEKSSANDPAAWKAYVYDETALLHLDEIVRMLAERKVRDPKAVIDSILGI